MNVNNKKEDLKFYLPDYISDKIEDTAIIEDIEKEIQTDPDFKKQYNEVRDTLNFLGSAEFEVPNENYFNNLSVKINEKILYENPTESIWERLRMKWKLILPAAVIVIISLILLNFWTRQQPEIIISEAETKKEAPVEENKITESKEKSNIENSNELNSKSETHITDNSVNKVSRNRQPNKINSIFQDDNVISNNLQDELNEVASEEDEKLLNILSDNTDISEIAFPETDEDALFPDDYDESIDDEIKEFSPEELKEILIAINKTQI